MADRIVCKLVARAGDDSRWPHDHIEAVGIGDSSGCSYKWTVAQVRHLLNAGYRFYVVDLISGRQVEVGKLDCGCGAQTLRVRLDGLRDDELKDLPECDSQNGHLHPVPSGPYRVAVESQERVATSPGVDERDNTDAMAGGAGVPGDQSGHRRS